MWLADGPLINPIRDIIHETAAIADAAGAHLVLTGDGGDYVLDQDHYLADILRIGRVRSFLSDLRASAAWRGVPIGSVASAPMRQLTPQPARVVARRLRSLKRAPRASLVRPCEVPDSPPDRWSPSRLGFPSETQEVLAADIHHPIVAWMNEAQGNLFAGHGIDLTHPFFDRGVVEFVLGIHPGDLPFDGRSKTLVRQAFASDLPASVLDRRRKTIFDEYFDQALRPHHLEYRARYPSVGPNAAAIIDDTAYRRALRTFDEGQTTGRSFRTLQRAWYVMAWLDSLGAYQRPRR
jgi:asparagine synthetase B (glutamine-hydrolysing)